MHAHVLVNQASGQRRRRSEAILADLAARLAAYGIRARVSLVEAREVRREVRESLTTPIDVVVVAGGDGTVSAAAAEMLDDPRPLAVLPLGTRNHFARDVGLPSRLDDAIACLAAGHVRAVDCGELNGRLFLNNSSLGVYPDIVVRRELDRRVNGRGRFAAFLRALWQGTRLLPELDLRIAFGAEVIARRSPFVLIANNAYRTRRPWQWGRRPRLDGASLFLYIATASRRSDLVGLATRRSLGLATPALEVLQAPTFAIHSSHSRLRASLDGEVFRLAPPLHYRVLPGALRVVAPAASSIADDRRAAADSTELDPAADLSQGRG